MEHFVFQEHKDLWYQERGLTMYCRTLFPSIAAFTILIRAVLTYTKEAVKFELVGVA